MREREPVNIIGVDFSGARSDQHTWLARGVIDGPALVLHECRPVTRLELTQLLAGAVNPTVAALDFPFAVPQEFARCWHSAAHTMPDLWEAAAATCLEQFLELRHRFVSRHGEVKRLADTYFPECYSCLHLANPNMVPMTFRGMQMLHRLWQWGCAVPPLPDSHGYGPVLLEAMPGAALRALGLPYKGYKNGKSAMQLRQRILEGLSQRSSVPIPGLSDCRDQCLAYHDCLDAVVAAVIAVLWARGKELFRCPAEAGSPEFDPRVLLEGWLYAPVYLQPGMPQYATPPDGR
jgi:hypothetical protein